MIEVIIANEQTDCKISKQIENAVRAVCEKVLETEEVDVPAEVSVTFVDRDEIQRLNAEHRQKDAVTDVLSFPMLEFDEDGNCVYDDYDFEPDSESVLLGDIVICAGRAMEQAEEFGHSILREISFLTAHSMLHLLGYDHVDDEDGERIMNEKQEHVLDSLGITRD